MSKNILLSSVVILGIFVLLFLISPVFTGFGFGPMMGGRYSSQSWGSNGCPFFNGGGTYNGGNNDRGMMDWNDNGNYGGMMGNWR